MGKKKNKNCPTCKGTGRNYRAEHSSRNPQPQKIPCKACDGSGKVKH